MDNGACLFLGYVLDFEVADRRLDPAVPHSGLLRDRARLVSDRHDLLAIAIPQVGHRLFSAFPARFNFGLLLLRLPLLSERYVSVASPLRPVARKGVGVQVPPGAPANQILTKRVAEEPR